MLALCRKCRVTFDIDESAALSGGVKCPRCQGKLSIMGLAAAAPAPAQPVQPQSQKPAAPVASPQLPQRPVASPAPIQPPPVFPQPQAQPERHANEQVPLYFTPAPAPAEEHPKPHFPLPVQPPPVFPPPARPALPERPFPAAGGEEWDLSGLEKTIPGRPSFQPGEGVHKTMIGPFAAWTPEAMRREAQQPAAGPAFAPPPAAAAPSPEPVAPPPQSKVEVNLGSAAQKPMAFQSPVVPPQQAVGAPSAAPYGDEDHFFSTPVHDTGEVPLWDESLTIHHTKLPKLAYVAIGIFFVGILLSAGILVFGKRGKSHKTDEPQPPKIEEAAPAEQPSPPQPAPAQPEPQPQVASVGQPAEVQPEKEPEGEKLREEEPEKPAPEKAAETPAPQPPKKKKPPAEAKVESGGQPPAEASKAKSHYEQGTKYFFSQEYDQAIAEYQKAINADRNFAYAYRGLGAAYASIGKNDEAIKSYKRYVDLDPKASDAEAVRKIINDYQQQQ